MDAGDWDRRYSGKELVWSVEPNRFVAEVCADLPAGRMIDLAAGEGRNAIWFAERGWDATAVDFSPVAIETAERLAGERGVELNTEVADLTTHEPTPGGYDLVVVAYLQLPDELLTPILRRAAAAVAPGGTCCVVAHDRDNLERGHGGPPSPEVLTTVDQVVGALTSDGTLDIVRAEQVDRPVTTEDGERLAIDTLVVARRPA